jgi:hypothetical protein
MPAVTAPMTSTTLARLFGWRRLLFTLLVSFVVGGLIGLGWHSAWWSAVVRVVALGLIAMTVFGLCEQWPKQLPTWLPRWVFQVVGVAISIPIGTSIFWILSTPAGAPPFWENSDRLLGFVTVTVLGILLTPWIALGALVRQKDALVRHQALAFELERSEFERNALDARLRLLQAQVEPHFLFNTLANIRELVDAGSPQASSVLASLIAYLRAVVPRLQDSETTVEHEINLARAYLEVMHMRMPDRLQFTLHADQAALALHCPPMTVLTLVENAVRHGVDPSEEGGRIDVRVRMQNGRCRIEVTDSGVGLTDVGDGLGTGLGNLSERLQLAFAGQARLRLVPLEPHGVCAEVEFPAMSSAT